MNNGSIQQDIVPRSCHPEAYRRLILATPTNARLAIDRYWVTRTVPSKAAGLDRAGMIELGNAVDSEGRSGEE